jgi:hypothetical protein
MSGTNPYDPSSTGKTRYDNDFDVSSETAQARFVALCELYRDERFVYNREVLCPMELFRDFIVADGGTFPVPQASFATLLANFTRSYEDTNGPAPDYSGATSSTKQDAASREARRYSQIELYQAIRFDLESSTPKLRYMLMIVNTTLSAVSTGSEIEPMFDHWNTLLRTQNGQQANIDTSLNRGFQAASVYIDMVLEQTLLRAAVVGIAASISLSFVVIVILTSDFLLSVLAILGIGGVVTSLIAIIVWMGWSLSILESICLTILV